MIRTNPKQQTLPQNPAAIEKKISWSSSPFLTLSIELLMSNERRLDKSSIGTERGGLGSIESIGFNSLHHQ